VVTHADHRDDRAVVFDLDETLHRLRRFTVGGYAHVARRLESRMGRPAGSVFRRLWGMYREGNGRTAYQSICTELGLPPEEATSLLRDHRAHLPRLRLTRSADEALRQMRGTWRVGILTNGMPGLQRIKVAALDLDARVDAIVYADELVAGGKPALDVFARIAADLGVPPGRCVMVGDDGVADVQGGHAAGMRTIWLRRPNRPSPPEGTADAIVQSLAEVPAIAARLIGDSR